MEDTVRIKMTRDVLRGGKLLPEGTVLEVPEKEAKRVIVLKKAVLAGPENKENPKGGDKK